MAPRSQQEWVADELRAAVDEARKSYESAPTGPEREAAMLAWKQALDAFVAAVLPKEEP